MLVDEVKRLERELSSLVMIRDRARDEGDEPDWDAMEKYDNQIRELKQDIARAQRWLAMCS